MAYTTTYLNGHSDNMVRKFVIDTATDITGIDTAQLKPGSTVFVIDTSSYYMLNHQQEWIPIESGSLPSHLTIDGSNEDATGSGN